MSSWEPWNDWFEWGEAKEVDGGLVARRTTARTARAGEPAFGVGTVLLATLESRASSGVVQRGRSYARKGQTVSLTIGVGAVRAAVQGASDDPYSVVITVDITPDARAGLIAILRRVVETRRGAIPPHAPPAVVAELAAADLLRGVTIDARCSCPYGAVCKHCITVAILAGERLDESPAAIANFFGVTAADVALRGAIAAEDDGPDDAAQAQDTPRFDPRRQARLATSLTAMDATPPSDRDAVVAAAVKILPASDQIRRLLDLPRG